VKPPNSLFNGRKPSLQDEDESQVAIIVIGGCQQPRQQIKHAGPF